MKTWALLAKISQDLKEIYEINYAIKHNYKNAINEFGRQNFFFHAEHSARKRRGNLSYQRAAKKKIISKTPEYLQNILCYENRSKLEIAKSESVDSSTFRSAVINTSGPFKSLLVRRG